MSATDDLRRLLDEHGVKWEAPIGILSYIKTVWRSGLWEYTAIETSGGEFSVYVEHRSWLTSEQVIDTTLGRRTCRIVADRVSDTDAYWESTLEMECGAEFVWAGSDYPVCCPYCGGKVVE